MKIAGRKRFIPNVSSYLTQHWHISPTAHFLVFYCNIESLGGFNVKKSAVRNLTSSVNTYAQKCQSEKYSTFDLIRSDLNQSWIKLRNSWANLITNLLFAQSVHAKFAQVGKFVSNCSRRAKPWCIFFTTFNFPFWFSSTNFQEPFERWIAHTHDAERQMTQLEAY